MSAHKDTEINTGRLTLAHARELLGNTSLTDTELEKVLENLRTYCSIVYQVHQKIKQENKENAADNKHYSSDEDNNSGKKHNIKDAA